MLAHKTKDFKVQTGISLEVLVPQNKLYRQLEAKLDLSFVHDLVKSTYAITLGAPRLIPSSSSSGS